MCLCAIITVYGAISLNFDTATAHERNSVIVVSIVLLNLPRIVFYGYIVYQLGKFNFQTPLKVLCVRESREQNERSALLNHA